MNKGSGHLDAEQTRAAIAALLDEAGRAHRFLLIDDPAHITRLAREALELARAQQGAVVAAGGDGTLNAVAQVMLGSGVPFGVLPQGTFNYFGRAHGISQEPEQATRALLRAQVQPVQVGQVNDRVFLVNASLGLYPKLLEDREAHKQQYGRSRVVALFSALRTLLRERGQLRLSVEFAGQTRALRTPSLFIGNNPIQLERLGFAEARALDQGLLAAIAVRAIGTWQMLGLVLRGALGKLGDAEQVISTAFRTLTVQPRGQRYVKVGVDGEILRLRAPLVFRVAPEPLLLLVPQPEDRVKVE